MKYRKSPLQIEKQNRVLELRKQAAAENGQDAVPFSKESMAALEERFYGKLVLKSDPGYDDDREEFDPVYEAFPQLIAYVACYADVKLMLEFAKTNKLQVAIRSGGHSFGGYSVCDGIVIDVSGLNNIYVDAEEQTAV